MKRTTGFAVLATATILIVAGNAPRLPWEPAMALVRQRVIATTTWPVRTPRDLRAYTAPAAPASHDARPVSVWPALPKVSSLTHLRIAALPRVMLPRTAGGLTLALGSGAAAGIALALLLLALANALQGQRGERRHAQRLAHIRRLAQAGQAHGRIARAARVPRDAVRTLLAPDGSQPR